HTPRQQPHFSTLQSAQSQVRKSIMSEKCRHPLLTVDIIIEVPGGVVLIERKNPPHGWALPGGFVDYGESIERAAVREAKEETSLQVQMLAQVDSTSDARAR